MSKKLKEINLEQWLNEKQSWFLPNDFVVVKDFMSKQDNETVNKLCSYFKGGITYLSGKHDSRLYSPKTMLVSSIFGVPPMLEFTMHSKYSVLTHWLWYFLTLIKYISIFVIIGLVWYIYDIVTVKKKTREYNFEIFCNLTDCKNSENVLSNNTVPNETEKTELPRNRKINMKTIKIMSIIGIIGFLGMLLYSFYDLNGYFKYDCDFFARSAISGVLLIFAIPYTIIYSILGLSVFKQNKLYLTGLILSGLQLICALIYIVEEIYFCAYFVFIASIIVFVLYIVCLQQILQQENKKISRKKLMFILGGVIIAIGLTVGISSYQYSQEPETDTEYSEYLTNETMQHNTETSEEKTYDYGIDYGLKKEELPADFLGFLTEFTKGKETQISLIHNPLTHNFLADVETDYGDFDYVEKIEYWNEEKIITDWNFIKSNTFIWGLKKDKDGEIFGSWTMEKGKIVYRTGIPETDMVWSLTFQKINGNWCLFSFWTNESGL